MLTGIIFKKCFCKQILIDNNFSRLSPIVHNKLNGTPVQSYKLFQQRRNLVMADRKHIKNGVSNRTESASSSGSNNCNCSNRSTIPTHISRVQNKRKQKRSTEESISVVHPGNYNYSNFAYGPCTLVPVQPYYFGYNQFNYHHFTQALVHNLNYACFHRPQGASHERQLRTVSSQDVLHGSINGLRFWEKLASDNGKPGFVFSVMSYNVLAQDLIYQHPHLYSFHVKENLKWAVRWNNLLNEIKSLSPDILCLQEVQGSHLQGHFSALNSLGYEGVYKQRTGVRTDGCAIYYKKSLITMIEHTTVEYHQPEITLLNRDNVAIIARFAPKMSPKNQFVVATTHLLYNPRRADVRLAQTQLLLTEVERIAFNGISSERYPYLPVIVTGDLNSTPDSVIYQFIARGHLKYEDLSPRNLEILGKQKTGKVFLPSSLRITDKCQHADLLLKRQSNETLPRNEEQKLIELGHSEWENRTKNEKKGKINSTYFSTGTLSHEFALKSVYKHIENGVREGTTFQDEWITVDYIFFSKRKSDLGKLVLLERYKLPTETQLGNMSIPNSNLGSDHLSLTAKFKLEF